MACLLYIFTPHNAYAGRKLVLRFEEKKWYHWCFICFTLMSQNCIIQKVIKWSNINQVKKLRSVPNYHYQLIMKNNCLQFKVVIEIHLCKQSVFIHKERLQVDLNFCPEVQKKEQMVWFLHLAKTRWVIPSESAGSVLSQSCRESNSKERRVKRETETLQNFRWIASPGNILLGPKLRFISRELFPYGVFWSKFWIFGDRWYTVEFCIVTERTITAVQGLNEDLFNLRDIHRNKLLTQVRTIL